jgi:hypothetical protein
MDFSAQFDDLSQRVAKAKTAAQAATSESRDQLKQRIDQAEGDLDRKVEDTKQGASEASAAAGSKWAQLKADASSRRDNVKAKIDQRNRQMDAKVAADEADWAETDAAAALDYAAWTVDNARLSVLDAIDARAYAAERAKLASSQ